MDSNTSAKIVRASLGVSEFLAFIEDWGHPEWVVLAAEAPFEQVSRLLAAAHSAKQVLRDVPLRAARKQDDEIAPFVAVTQSADAPWSVAFISLCLPIDEQDVKSAQDDAQMLSAKLKTRALSFIGEGTSGAMGYHLYQNGKEVEHKEWDQTKIQTANKVFAPLGLYLPACYPSADRRGAWLAVASSSASCVQRADFLKFGEPADAKEAKALLNAVLRSRLAEVRRLLRNGVTPTHEALTKAIAKAAWSGKYDVLKELLKRPSERRIPLRPSLVRVAISQGQKNPKRRMDVVKLLLAAGADINGEGGEALRTAMRQQDLALVNFLLEAGADVNISNDSGSTPLHYAAFLGEIEFAKLLLQAGASLDAMNSDGKTPAQWAAFHGCKEMAKLLQDAAKP